MYVSFLAAHETPSSAPLSNSSIRNRVRINNSHIAESARSLDAELSILDTIRRGGEPGDGVEVDGGECSAGALIREDVAGGLISVDWRDGPHPSLLPEEEGTGRRRGLVGGEVDGGFALL